MSDNVLISLELGVAVTAAWAWAIAALYWALRRSRPELRVGGQLIAAATLRIAGIVAISAFGVAGSLRGGDESVFLQTAHEAVAGKVGAPSLSELFLHKLQIWVLAVQLEGFDASQLALRISEVGIVVVGLLLLMAAVYELAGQKAAAFAGWLLAIEPASVFFSGILHKEALMTLAGGLVALGGAKMWKQLGVQPLLLMVCGCLIAIPTRTYIGWFLIAASLLITLHASVLQLGRARARSLGLLAAGAAFVAAVTPAVLQASSHQSLEKNLQGSQDANASDTSNLRLERVDYSSRSSVVLNLPRRMRDVLLRPFPWQIGNVSQRLGVLGTAFAYALIVMLITQAVRERGEIMVRAGPFLYLGLLLLVAYSLSAGNAGTAFRYRSHVVAMGIAALAVLRARREPVTASDGERREPAAGRTGQSAPFPARDDAWKQPLTT